MPQARSRLLSARVGLVACACVLLALVRGCVLGVTLRALPEGRPRRRWRAGGGAIVAPPTDAAHAVLLPAARVALPPPSQALSKEVAESLRDSSAVIAEAGPSSSGSNGPTLVPLERSEALARVHGRFPSNNLTDALLTDALTYAAAETGDGGRASASPAGAAHSVSDGASVASPAPSHSHSQATLSSRAVREGRAGQGRAGQGRAGQGRAGQGRAGQGRAGQGRRVQARAGQARTGEWRGEVVRVPVHACGVPSTCAPAPAPPPCSACLCCHVNTCSCTQCCACRTYRHRRFSTPASAPSPTPTRSLWRPRSCMYGGGCCACVCARWIGPGPRVLRPGSRPVCACAPQWPSKSPVPATLLVRVVMLYAWSPCGGVGWAPSSPEMFCVVWCGGAAQETVRANLAYFSELLALKDRHFSGVKVR
jgi:hypothetical protein